MSVNLQDRNLQPEVMDQPDLDRKLHQDALAGLERINGWSRTANVYWPLIAELARTVSPRPLRILDIASGAGDIPIALWQCARRAGIPIEIEGCDISPVAIQYARDIAQQRDAKMHFFEHNIHRDTLPNGFDVVTCSLFLHHLDEKEAIQLLRDMGQAASHLVLISDLLRSRIGYWMAFVGSRLLTRCPVVHTDGPRSVENAYTIPEIQNLAEQAGLSGAKVAKRWPERFLLTWRRT
jgi:2-polyprenyl-3-methyl-5-hydroxy-6-metoxy-1,4-benzoquinol methylase